MIDSEAVYREYVSEITAFSAALLRSKEDGEDCAQEVFLTMMEKKAVLTGENIRGWLYSAARFKAMNMLRARRHTADIGEYAELLPDSAHTERAALVRLSLGVLDESETALLCKRYIGNESALSLAECIGISEQALNKRLRVYKCRFKSAYEGYAVRF